MKIFLCILWIASTSLATPAVERSLFKRDVASGSESGSNLLQAATQNSSSLDQAGSSTFTDSSSKNEKDSQSKQNATNAGTTTNAESRSFLGQISDAALHSDEFKIRVLDLTHPTKADSRKSAEVSINPLLYQHGFNVIKVPEVYVLKVPQVVLVKETDFLRGNHYAFPTIAGPFNPFEDVPSVSQGFPSSDGIFEIPSVIPAYPIEVPQVIGQFPIIGVGSEIPVISDISGIPQGIEVLKPGIISTIEPAGLTDEKIDHETDSVTVEALGKQKALVEPVDSTTKASEEHANGEKLKENMKQ